LFHFVEAKSNVVGDVTLVTTYLECLTELVLSLLEFLFLVKNAALSNNGLSTLRRKLANQAFSVRHFFKFILNVDLDLYNFVRILRILNLRSYLASFGIHTGLEQRLGMIELVLVHVGVELGELVVVFGGLCVVLDVEVAVCEQREGSSTAGLELELVVENVNDLIIW